MVRAPLVDKQWISRGDSEHLLDALSPLLQTFFDGLNFSLERLGSPHQFDRLIGMFSACESNLPAKLSSGCNQLPHRLLRFLDLIDRPLGQRASVRKHDLTMSGLFFRVL